ncbi:MAG: hypothetical protein CL609_11285 [Anaerolineaceae bacterium]|nr:hypothetical protein [Anaerolineaceae bacterium]
MKNKILNKGFYQKMGFRLLAGFIILVIFVGVLISAMSFYQFSKLSTALETIDLYQIPVVDNATNVERFILSALDYEKTYFLTNDPLYQEKTTKAISSASLSLSELIRLAEKYENDVLDDQSSKLWLSLESYRQSFLKVVSTIKENTDLRDLMRESGEDLNQQAESYINSKLNSENDLLMDDALKVGFEISQSIQSLRVLESKYLFNNDPATIEMIYAELDRMENLYNQLSSYSISLTDSEMVFASRESAANYRQAISTYAQNQSELISLKQSMQTKGEEIQQITQEVEKTNWQAMETAQADAVDQMKTAQVGLIVVLGISFVLAILLARQLTHSITKPLALITAQAKRIANGDLLRDTTQAEQNLLSKRKDEIGDIAAAFTQMIRYLQNIGLTAREVTEGNLSIDFQPVSPQDELGNVFSTMVQQLRLSMIDVAKNISVINRFSAEMEQIAAQSDSAALQISDTMSQISNGTTEQTASLQQAFSAIKRSQSGLTEIVSGFNQQTKAVDQGAFISENLVTAVELASENFHQVVKESDQATQVAQNGAEKIGTTLQNIEGIQLQVERSQEKVSAMQSQTNKIGRIVETIEDIAAQTNLLAINATIEAAHAESDSRTLTESMLERFMLAACEMIARLLETSNDIPNSYWVEMGKLADIDQILITDDDGVIVIGNDPALMGFRFPEDNPQTAEFRTLIGKKNGRVCQPAQMRAADKQVYKYAGISRRDVPGVVQVGYNMSTLSLFNFQIGGFTVVAREVYELAESSRTATKEIRQLLKAIQDAANEANQEMKKSVGSVKTSLSEAANAGENLNEILTAFSKVTDQTRTADNATLQMKKLSSDFRSAIQTIQNVVESNREVAEQVMIHTNEMASSMDRIASVSEENSAATEEVTASTKELQSQVNEVAKTAEQLSEMANQLTQIVAKFNLEN